MFLTNLNHLFHFLDFLVFYSHKLVETMSKTITRTRQKEKHKVDKQRVKKTKQTKKNKITKKHDKSRNTSRSHSHSHTSRSTSGIGAIQKPNIIMVEKSKVESLLLFNILLNYYVLLVSHHVSAAERRSRLEKLIMQMRENNKLISRDTTAIQIKNIVSYLDTFFNQLLILLNKSLEHEKKERKLKGKATRNHKGGFYFKSLEEKGENPITGADLTRLLDEMQQFFYNAKYTQEGQFLQDTDTLLSMLRGDVNQFKGILQYRIFPQFYSAMPPFIKWDAIYHELIEKRRWEDLPDYLLAYQSYLRSRDEYLVEKGLKPPSVLQRDLYTGFFNKMSNSINDNMYAFQNARNKFQGRFFPITLPP